MRLRKETINLLAIIFIGSLWYTSSTQAFDHTHGLWTQVLQKYVKNGRFDYKGLKSDESTFAKYQKQLTSVTLAELSEWSREQKLAYWINAYNAYTIRSIIDHYPVKSIKKIPGVWKKLKFHAGGEKITLDDIEHKKLRAELKEPRIHFAINCASIGCPVISDEAYRANDLEAQLEKSVNAMLTNTSQFRLDRKKKRIHLSKVLDWFRDDFTAYKRVNNYGKNSGIISFLLRYLPESDQSFIKSNKLTIKWLDYDWSLNETT